MSWRKRSTVPYGDRWRLPSLWAWGLAAASSALMFGCAMLSKDQGKPAPTPAAPAVPSPAPAVPGVKGAIKLPPPDTPRSWADARQQAARRLVAASPDGSYMGKPPDMLLAIPVLTIELNADGGIRHIAVMRYPSQARETVEMAMAAVRRAAPFGDVSKLPKPWKFNETFLFNAERKFKPMTLDQH